ncbi:MAG: hypothetical protein JWO98_236 [Frankiales bacterium]|nr:hypothetical protein [Frankiales bacterium]
MTDAPAPLSRATSPRELDDMARELAGWGWIVRFELHSFAGGAPGRSSRAHAPPLQQWGVRRRPSAPP